MAEGPVIGKLTLRRKDIKGEFGTFLVREHHKQPEPQDYIAQCKSLSRELFNGAERNPFYRGARSKGRVTFMHDGVWCYVDDKDNPTNLLEILFNNLAPPLIPYSYSFTRS